MTPREAFDEAFYEGYYELEMSARDAAEHALEAYEKAVASTVEKPLEHQTQWARKRVRQGREWMQRCTRDVATHFRSVKVQVVEAGEWREKQGGD